MSPLLEVRDLSFAYDGGEPVAIGRRSEVFLADGTYDVTLTVTDDGVGFSSDLVEAAFQPLQRLSTIGVGQGIGLAIAEALATATGIAITPLLGVSAVGAWKAYKTPPELRGQLPWYAARWFWVPGLAIALLLVNAGNALAADVIVDPYYDYRDEIGRGEFSYDDSQDIPWIENETEVLAPPRDEDLVPVSIDRLPAEMELLIDERRITFNPDDRVIRLWLVLRSRAGGREGRGDQEREHGSIVGQPGGWSGRGRGLRAGTSA